MLSSRRISFPFPSNGKVHGKVTVSVKHNRLLNSCFHSLQTGKFMERYPDDAIKAELLFVSIPFKRESSWKAISSSSKPKTVGSSFHSLQTGKFMESEAPEKQADAQPEVSIPFKRESSWKVGRGVSYDEGNAQVVSIPFKRESSWKVVGLFPTNGSLLKSFHSLQTGKCLERKIANAIAGVLFEFQFPSNGKVLGKHSMKM